MAKKNEMATVRIMAKDLVRTRGTCKKFMIMRANIQISRPFRLKFRRSYLNMLWPKLSKA